MDASDPSRKNTNPRQFSAEILGMVIAFTTLVLPILLITNFSNQYNSNSLSSNAGVLWEKES